MDPNEIFKYVAEGAGCLAAGGLTYLTALVGSSAVSDVFSKKITSQEDLDGIVSEEVEKLGMDKPVRANFHGFDRADAKKTAKGSYVVNVGGSFATRGGVRHELYHIHKGHVEDNGKSDLVDKIDYYFRQEPQAIAYEVFRIKI